MQSIYFSLPWRIKEKEKPAHIFLFPTSQFLFQSGTTAPTFSHFTFCMTGHDTFSSYFQLIPHLVAVLTRPFLIPPHVPFLRHSKVWFPHFITDPRANIRITWIQFRMDLDLEVKWYFSFLKDEHSGNHSFSCVVSVQVKWKIVPLSAPRWSWPRKRSYMKEKYSSLLSFKNSS